MNRVLKNVRIDSLALVKAPPCEKCGTPMLGFDDWRWVCPNDDCDQNTTPVHVGGVYPFKVIK